MSMIIDPIYTVAVYYMVSISIILSSGAGKCLTVYQCLMCDLEVISQMKMTHV